MQQQRRQWRRIPAEQHRSSSGAVSQHAAALVLRSAVPCYGISPRHSSNSGSISRRSKHRCRGCSQEKAASKRTQQQSALKQHTNISHHHQQQQHNSASFKNKENINLEAVPKFKTHDADAGSTQVQIARLTARIEQISTHLRANRKDFSSKRGLEQVLSQRKRLLKYLYRTDRASYDRLISELGIRSVIAGDSHKAAQREAAAAAAAN